MLTFSDERVSFKKKEKLSDRTGGVTIMQTATKKETVLGIRQMAMIGVMTAVTCIAAPFSIPIPVSPVPLSLTTFILYLSVYILGTRNAFISYVIYLLLGLVGLPVFSGFSGGFAKLAGMTGGYLIGFLFMIPLTGILFEKTGKSFWKQFGAMVLGTLVCYLFGTVWLCLQLNLDFIGGLGVGVIPYLPGDTAKIILAALIGPVIVKSVKTGGIRRIPRGRFFPASGRKKRESRRRTSKAFASFSCIFFIELLCL